MLCQTGHGAVSELTRGKVLRFYVFCVDVMWSVCLCGHDAWRVCECGCDELCWILIGAVVGTPGALIVGVDGAVARDG